MSNSKLISYTCISPNKTTGNFKKDTVTVHCMAGQLSVESCGKLFADPARQASSNYGIGNDGRIALYVDEKDRSWCSSNAANDQRSITIEVASDSKAPYAVSDTVMASLLNLLVDICQRNKIKTLVWSDDKNERVNHLNGCNMTVHRDFKNKSCPGDYLMGKMPWIADTVNYRLGITKKVANADTYPKYTGSSVSIVTALSSVGEKDTSMTHRKAIAASNGIANYGGTATQNTQLLDKLKAGKLLKAGATVEAKATTPAPTPAAKTVVKYPRYKGLSTSIITALSTVGEKDTSMTHRKKIAAANGIKNYSGTAVQNTQLVKLIKAGNLIKA